VVRRPARGEMAETYIRLFGPSMEQEAFPKETLSLEAIMSNGYLPRLKLEAGAIKEPIKFPAGVEAANLTVPAEVLECPDQQNYLWALISHLTLSYSTLAEIDNLKKLLSLYNWSPSQTNPNKKRIQGIKKVHEPAAKSIQYQRGVIRGIEFRLEVDPEKFEHGAGDIHLFGMVLNRFLSQYVTINSFAVLTIIEEGTDREYKWEPNLGSMLTV
jgi:type VI secretion system protein ImpG